MTQYWVSFKTFEVKHRRSSKPALFTKFTEDKQRRIDLKGPQVAHNKGALHKQTQEQIHNKEESLNQKALCYTTTPKL